MRLFSQLGLDGADLLGGQADLGQVSFRGGFQIAVKDAGHAESGG